MQGIAQIEFCLQLPQDNTNSFSTTNNNKSDNNSSGTSQSNISSHTTPTTPIYQHGPELPSIVTAWTTTSHQEHKAISRRDLHKIIEASFQNNKDMHQQPHPTQPNITPLSPAILAAILHPGKIYIHATTYRGNFLLTENQNEFNTLHALHESCTIVSYPNGSTPTHYYKSIQNTINQIVSNIQYTLFQELLFSQYAGEAQSAISSSDFTNDTIRQINKLNLQFTH